MDTNLDEVSGSGDIVPVVLQRIADRLGNDDAAREMNHGVDPMLLDQRADQRLIAGVTGHQYRFRRYGPALPGGKIVHHDHPLALGDQPSDGVRADVAGPTGHQHCAIHAHTVATAYRLLRKSA